jgi:hypothetical protein
MDEERHELLEVSLREQIGGDNVYVLVDVLGRNLRKLALEVDSKVRELPERSRRCLHPRFTPAFLEPGYIRAGTDRKSGPTRMSGATVTGASSAPPSWIGF